MKPKAAERKAAESQAAETAPALPAWKAFVVQFGRDAGGRHGVFAGRVEHLSSGRRAQFGSGEELLATLGRMLDEIEKSE